MHFAFDRSTETIKRMYRSGGAGVFVLPVVLAAMIGLAIAQPNVSTWMFEIAQSEFAGGNAVPEIAPTQLAQPRSEIRTVKAD
jgi:hypothetical protein